MRKRRYEILLPIRYNDGRLVKGKLLEQTREELVARFESVTIIPHSVLGIWVHQGFRYEDELRRFTVDVKDTASNRLFFAKYKATLRKRFRQIEIYIVSYPIDIV
jgi:hypothetical protein